MRIDGTNITMIRGDTEIIHLSVVKSDGQKYSLSSGDTIHFTVKHSPHSADIKLQKVITSFQAGDAHIRLDPADTRDIGTGDYVYDIQLTQSNGDIRTVVWPSKFSLKGEVTRV